MNDAVPSLVIGVPKERIPGERRVALVPAGVALLEKKGMDVIIEKDAGREAGFTDEMYTEKGATVVGDASAVFERASVILQVRAAAAAPDVYSEYKPEQVVIAHCDPLSDPAAIQELASRRVTAFSLELLPRITRAQSMDVLSSMATIAGYKAVLMAADTLPRMFPMLMTAAGTVTPARVLIMGAGVAGLQAIATAKRLGAVVSSYDIRPAVKEQVESLGAKFVELDLKTESAETKGGYAKEMGEEFLQRQRELMTEVIAESDVVITTALIPGRKAPVLVTTSMVEAMAPGSVVIDIAAERGGNCEVTKAGEVVDHNGVSVVGPVNLPATIPYHASEMYSKNITTFLTHLVTDGKLAIDPEDEIDAETLLCRDGEVLQPRLREMLGLPPIEPPAEPEPKEETIPVYDGDDEPQEIRHEQQLGDAASDASTTTAEADTEPAPPTESDEPDAADPSGSEQESEVDGEEKAD